MSDQKEEKTFKCTLCSKEFSSEQELNEHMTTTCLKRTDTQVSVLPPTPPQNNLQTVLSYLEDLLGEEQLSPTNLLLYALRLEQFVESLTSLSGPEKKDLVLSSFREYARRKGMNGTLQNYLQNILPSFIDVSVSLDKGKTKISLDLEEVAEAAESCCSFLKRGGKKN